MFLHQHETNVAAHGMSSMEEAKWRLWDADPEMLCDPFESLQALRATEQAKREAEERERQVLLGTSERPLSANVAQLTERLDTFTHHPGTLAVHASFERN